MLQQLLILMATCVVLSFFNKPVFAEADVEEDEEVTFTEENTRKKIPWRLYRIIVKDLKDDDAPLPAIPSKLNENRLEGLFKSEKTNTEGSASGNDAAVVSETENKEMPTVNGAGEGPATAKEDGALKADSETKENKAAASAKDVDIQNEEFDDDYSEEDSEEDE